MRIALRAAAVAVAITVALATSASAQDHPDFSGTWTLAQGGGPGGPAARGGPAGPGGPDGPGRGRGGMGMMLVGFGRQVQIEQDANALTIVREAPMGEIRQVYRLDGSESRNSLSMGGNQIELVSRATWEGESLVIVTPITMGNMSGETRVTLSIDESGALVAETTRPGGPGGSRTMQSTYTRQ